MLKNTATIKCTKLPEGWYCKLQDGHRGACAALPVPDPLPDVVTYKVYAHGSKESAWEAASDAGFTEDQIREWGLQYAAYEVPVTVTVNTQTGKWTESIVQYE